MCSATSKNTLVIGPDYAKELLPLLEEANKSIDILMYDWRWYSKDFACDVSRINSAILRAERRGVKVRAITNADLIHAQLKSFDIDVKCWNKSKAMHAKCILIDDWIAVLGSHNLTENAMGLNIEVSVIVAEEHICTQLKNYFQSLWLLLN